MKKNNKYDVDALLRAALKNDGLQHPQTMNALEDHAGKLNLADILKNIARPLSTGAAIAVTLAFVLGAVFTVRYLNTLAPENFAGETSAETTRAFEVIKIDDDGFVYVTTVNTEETTEEAIIETTENIQETTEEEAAQGYIADAYYQLYYHGTNINEIEELYGWINVMGTRVSYPVVQCEDNEFYLNHSHDKNRNPAGAVFADYRNSKNIMQNRNTIIYGHNMLNGAMFAGLTEFGRDEELFRKGMIEIEITSENAIYCYEVFSVREEEITGESLINENDMVINFDSDEEYAGYLREMQRRSIFQKDIELGADSKIITLATWVNDVSTRKMFIVQGVFAGVKIP